MTPINRYFADLGIFSLEDKLTDEQKGSVYDAVELFVRGGGRPTWEEWTNFPPEIRHSFVIARRKIAYEQAALIGIAAQGIDEVAEVASESDGGAMQVRLALQRTMTEAVRSMSGKTFPEKG